MNLETAYWASRYEKDETGWDIGKISTPLKDYIDQLKDKSIKILIPGAGNAYEAEYLFQKGFRNVYVLDLAAKPLENFKHRCPHFPGEQLIQKDFFDVTGQFDLLLEQTFFCALPVKFRRLYAEKTFNLLKPQGKLVGLLFDKTFPTEGPPFGGNKNEYLEYFDHLFEIEVFNPCYNSIPPREGNELFFIFKKN